jgi:UDP-N-acetyl-D-galactosamine dehydrogenase
MGLPLAIAFARAGFEVFGYDTNEDRIAALKNGYDWTGETDACVLRDSNLLLTSHETDIAEASLFLITVPTPIDSQRRPDLRAVIAASETIGRVIHPGAVIVLESTVYPGVTEEVCGPIIARISGLVQASILRWAIP